MTAYTPYAAAVLSVLLCIFIIRVVVRHGEAFIARERWGMTIAAAATFLSIFRQLGLREMMLPWEGWYQILWRVGWFLFLWGMSNRLDRHDLANLAAVRLAREYLQRRRKLPLD